MNGEGVRPSYGSITHCYKTCSSPSPTLEGTKGPRSTVSSLPQCHQGPPTTQVRSTRRDDALSTYLPSCCASWDKTTALLVRQAEIMYGEVSCLRNTHCVHGNIDVGLLPGGLAQFRALSV